MLLLFSSFPSMLMLSHINNQLSKQQQQKVPDFCRYFVIFESFATPMYMFFYWFLAATTTPFLRSSLRRLEFYYVTVQTLMLFIYIEYYHHHHRRWGFAAVLRQKLVSASASHSFSELDLRFKASILGEDWPTLKHT